VEEILRRFLTKTKKMPIAIFVIFIFFYKEIIKLIFDVVNGLKRLHDNGRMHGDLKPGNIFISEERIYKRYSK
jgi:serine/threonine protein kinase